ncbi:MAG: hypothetical protein REI64_02330 [Pedobacter sp.]|uniref:hypothetical protein n=1 Tax=Pedobacter sp. TaxID=1411316 RepID=UPI002807BA50|nr:hypothetical protein [Pedobacter sp.]MDQ8003605.1 hypothetical protein [Pedobacter sp.]
MKRLNTLLYIILTFLCSVTLVARAQEYATTNNYYYNNFDDETIGSRFTSFGAASMTLSSTNLALGNGFSISSTANGNVGSYRIVGNISPTTQLSSSTYGYEWTFLYKSSTSNADNAGRNQIANGTNAWRFWLMAENPNFYSGKGYYITQVGQALKLMYRQDQWYDVEIASYTLPSLNTTYAVRIQRTKSSNKFTLFVDEYNSSQTEASTARGNNNRSDFDVYGYSGLEVCATQADRFMFDELKMYTMELMFTGANDPENGISNPLYAGQQNAAIYGLRAMARGLFSFYQFSVGLSGNITSIVNASSARLYKSDDSYYGNVDDSQIATLNCYNDKVERTSGGGYSNTSPMDRFYSVGNADGSLAAAKYYFVVVNVSATPNTTNSFAFTGTTTIQGANTNINYVSTGSTSNTTTGNSNSGKVFDWKGTNSTDWNQQANWSPNNQGVPGENDVARIGVSQTFNHQPQVSGDRKVGNVLVGTANSVVPVLDIASGGKLTVKNLFENLEGITIKGAGVLDILGSYIAKPTASAKTTTSEVATLNTTNLVFNTETRAVTFNATGANILVKNALQTSGANAATFTLGTGATLTLTGAAPISLAASTNTITLDNGSTVVYGAAVNQTINTTLSYKNISFSGAGTKQTGAGTLNVSGNWNSAGGKVNLTSGTVSFNGANQTITDAGSDSGNGITFGNISISGGTKALAGSGKFALAVGRFLTLGTNTILQTSDKLTLKASALGSASVSAIPSSSAVQGKVTVERYVQGGAKDMWRSYRMFSSPIYDNDGVNKTYSFTQFIDNMLITGKSAGFDQINNSATGAWTYNNGFVAIPSINTAVDVGRGAYILYRGDRTNGVAKVSVPYVDPESIIMDFKGTLNQQTVHVPLTHGSTTFSFLGNPYAATIDWTLVQKSSNVEATIRIWNPERKQYATHNGQYGINGGARYIGPGQGFFVQTTNNSSPYVTFTENSKVSNVAQSVPLYNKVMSVRDNTIGSAFSISSSLIEEEPVQIRVKLQRDGFENQDETLVLLQKNELASFSGYDVERTGGEAVFLSSLSSEGKKMAINYMPHISTLSIVNLDVNMSNNGNYKMTVDLADIPLGYELKLRDKFLNTFTDLSPDGTIYNLTVDRAQAATMGDRFEILISPPRTLPVVFTEFNGNRTNQGVLLKWKTSSEQDNSRFEIRRAGEEQIFTTIGTVVPNSNGIYQLLDVSPLAGNNYYKLYQVDKDGKSAAHDKVVVIKNQLNENVASQFSVYPTVVETNFTVKFNGTLSAKEVLVKISDMNGREVLQKKITEAEIFNGYTSVFPSVASGVYAVILQDVNNGKQIGAAKLIKK